MTNSKKLGLLLLPLIPLSAIGVVSIVNGLIPPKAPEITECKPTLEQAQNFAKPPKPTPRPNPPQPPPAK